ncbi:flavin reductase family protein [Cellulomonas sp. P24]|uniref:flavin reductase family protein n=1 Tax=Cellulomonas sp. P24 TaxID=2885206 RepID=UPI00216B0AA6|nr:flavin reductase family protein [Cellulomonas sp. P24]MCR6493850.1 flavin reductase family protein [Cellulomonas sp. P24]
MSATPEAFRAAIARLATGVVVVAVNHGGTDHAMTASTLTSVSLEPPMLLFCVHRESRFRDALDEVDQWAVSVLSDTGSSVADWFASPGRPVVGQFAQVPHRRGALSGAALVEDASAWFECRTAAIHRAGDHDIVIGDVVSAATGELGAGGLVHHRGRLRPVR